MCAAKRGRVRTSGVTQPPHVHSLRENVIPHTRAPHEFMMSSSSSHDTMDTEQSLKAWKRLVDNCVSCGKRVSMNSPHQSNNLATHGHTSFQNTLFTDTNIALQCVAVKHFSRNKQHLIFRPVGLDVVSSDVEHVYSFLVVFFVRNVFSCKQPARPQTLPMTFQHVKNSDLPKCQEQSDATHHRYDSQNEL